MPVRVVVGLGNPGSKYDNTRHNIGYRVLDELEERGFKDALLFRPDGFMNSSGVSVRNLFSKKGWSPADLLVVCDDFAIPIGTLRLRLKGSAGGHNGLKSLIEQLGTPDFSRLRVGIGPVPEAVDPADFVLGRFSAADRAALKDQIPRTADAVETCVREGLEAAMNRFNGKK